MRPRSRIAMAPFPCCRLRARCTPSSSGSSPIAPMPPTEWRPRPESSSRSCASRLAKSALPCIPGAGWSNASWPGSGATAASPRTSKERSSRQQPSSMPLPSCCSHDDLLVRFKIRVGRLDKIPECVTSTNDDLHPPVLRLAHTWAGRYQQMCIAKALDGDRVGRHAILDQFRGYGLGTTDRQALVVLRRAGGIGVAVNLDPRVLDACRIIGGFLDDLAGAVCQGRLVPVKEHEIRAGRRRCGSRCGSRWRWRLVEIVAQTKHHRMIEV